MAELLADEDEGMSVEKPPLLDDVREEPLLMEFIGNGLLDGVSEVREKKLGQVHQCWHMMEILCFECRTQLLQLEETEETSVALYFCQVVVANVVGLECHLDDHVNFGLEPLLSLGHHIHEGGARPRSESAEFQDPVNTALKLGTYDPL